MTLCREGMCILRALWLDIPIDLYSTSFLLTTLSHFDTARFSVHVVYVLQSPHSLFPRYIFSSIISFPNYNLVDARGLTQDAKRYQSINQLVDANRG